MYLMKLFLLFALSLCIKNGITQRQFSEEDLRHMRMMFCGTCKDENVRKDLIAFQKCAAENHEEMTSKIVALKEQFKNDPDGCFQSIFTLLSEYMAANPDSQKQAHGCFNANVKKEDLDKCH